MPDLPAPHGTRRARGFSTRAIAAASRPPKVSQRPTAVPIYQAAAFTAEDADELARVTSGATPGYSYARLANPTAAALEAAVAELHEADGAVAFGSGMAALHAAFASLLRAGDRVLASRSCYGSTRTLLVNQFSRLGVTVDFVDVTDHAAVAAALAAAPTRLLHAETISNPTIVVADHAALAALAHRHGALYTVDNTFASPYVCRPLELGADLVAESATKWLGGHSDLLAGVVAGPSTLLDAVRTVRVDTGGNVGALDAFLVLRGLQTLAVRMDRHAATAAALAAWLEDQAGVARVFYPSLASHPQHDLASRELASGGGMLAFELHGGRDAGPAFIDALTIPLRTASLGSVHTLVVHPPTTSHRQLSDAELREAGIGTGLLRCSVGLEDLDDLIDDFAAALAAVRSRIASVPAARA